MVIAVAGKGGTGKTTVAALIIEVLLSQNKKPILAVDADPNSTLGDYLGIRYQHTISDIMEETKGLRNLPDGVSKPTHLEYQLQRAITETKGVDLLVMGRPEGPECYCMANNILRGYLQKISSNYPYVVIDNEAGMEHLSRKTTQNIDVLILVSDPTKVGLQTAKRIRELIDKMTSLNIRNKYLLVNKFQPAHRSLGAGGLAPDTKKFNTNFTNGTNPTNNSCNSLYSSYSCSSFLKAEQITGLKVIGYLPYSKELSSEWQMEQVNPSALLIKPMTEIIERLFKFS